MSEEGNPPQAETLQEFIATLKVFEELGGSAGIEKLAQATFAPFSVAGLPQIAANITIDILGSVARIDFAAAPRATQVLARGGPHYVRPARVATTGGLSAPNLGSLTKNDVTVRVTNAEVTLDFFDGQEPVAHFRGANTSSVGSWVGRGTCVWTIET
ncbi:hypothetical protein BOTBODRAFT_193315 [Botryobasidium botryosum FD-172 SS1]|uniref:Uncharacterized protein n=1 Tax=Botryobasidium botryosum (strain FD-172 SS1) TaxID=930990 RepID=A0A067LQW7_BOTB1|nr:hypothetical protein BOTBODRAFT_193315 [Botryobasidium botryosum FD-172 SS1]